MSDIHNERITVRRNLLELVGKIQFEKSQPVRDLEIRKLCDEVKRAITLLETPFINETELSHAISLALISQARFEPPIVDRKYGVVNAKDNDLAQDKLRLLTNFTESK